MAHPFDSITNKKRVIFIDNKEIQQISIIFKWTCTMAVYKQDNNLYTMHAREVWKIYRKKKIYETLSENEIKQRISLDWFWWCYILLLLQVFVEHVDRQWGVWYVADQVLEIVGVTRQTTNGIGLRFNKFLLQVVSDLIMISKKQSKIRNVQYSSVVGMYKNLESQKKKYS